MSSGKHHPIVAPTALPRQRLFNSNSSLATSGNNQVKVKRNYVIEFEEKIQRLFQLKQHYVMRNAFQKMLPYQIVSPSLRENFEQLVSDLNFWSIIVLCIMDNFVA